VVQSIEVGRLAADGESLSKAGIIQLSGIFRECTKAGGVADHETAASALGIHPETAWRAFEYWRCQADAKHFVTHYCMVLSPQDEGGMVHAQKFVPVQQQLEYIDALNAGRLLPAVYDPDKSAARRIHFTKKARKEGWTTTTGLYFLHAMLFRQYEDISLISLDHYGSKTWLSDMMSTYDNLPDWLKRRYIKRTEEVIIFDNNSRVKAWPAVQKAGRSRSTTGIGIDEGATIQKDGKWVGLWAAAQGAGSLGIITTGSTCDCPGDSAYARQVDSSSGGHKRWMYHEWPWHTLPWHTPEWLQQQREECGNEAQFQTEYMMRWMGTGAPIMPIEIIQARIDTLMETEPEYDITFANAFIPSINPSGSNSSIAGKHIVKMWRPPRPGTQYVLAVDTSFGSEGKDRSAMVLLDQETREVPLTYHSSRNDLRLVVTHAYKISDIYGGCPICMERNGLGIAALQYAEQFGLGRLWKQDIAVQGITPFPSFDNAHKQQELQPQDYGLWITNDRKLEAYQKIYDLLIRDMLVIYDPAILHELTNITMDRNKRVHAGSGHDDLADALAIAVFISNLEYAAKIDMAQQVYTETSQVERAMADWVA